MSEQPDILTARATAARLGRSVSTVHRYVAEGKLTPALRIEGLRGAAFFHAADVDRLAARLAHPSKPDRAASPT